MKNFEKRTAVILFNLGGPDKISSVKSFLFNLFNDPAIIDLPQPFRFILAKFISTRRAPKTRKIYEKIGGKSPLYEITLSQAHALEYELSFFGNFKVFIAMRYWHPFAAEAVEEVKKYQPNKVILLPLYPQFSSATSKSSIEDFLQKLPKEIPTKTICCYPKDQEFIKSHAILIKQTIAKFYDRNLSEFRFLFSAHGLPQKLINAGDPYAFQVEESTKEVVKNLQKICGDEEKIDFQICYQSKVGPLQWTSPSLEHELRRAILDKKIPVVVPISFVSEHSETLVELDIDYKNLATKLGAKNYLRVPALNIEGHFIKSLTEICKKADEERARICPKKFRFCPNPNPCQI